MYRLFDCSSIIFVYVPSLSTLIIVPCDAPFIVLFSAQQMSPSGGMTIEKHASQQGVVT